MKIVIIVLTALIAAGGMVLVFRRFNRRLRQIEEEMWGPPGKK